MNRGGKKSVFHGEEKNRGREREREREKKKKKEKRKKAKVKEREMGGRNWGREIITASENNYK